MEGEEEEGVEEEEVEEEAEQNIDCYYYYNFIIM